MNDTTAAQLIALDNEFYCVHAASFSQTRQAPWEGWKRAWKTAYETLTLEPGRAVTNESHATNSGHKAIAARPTCSVLDLACGNLRFERALTETAPEVQFFFDALDCCDELAMGEAAATIDNLTYRSTDILAELLAHHTLPADALGHPTHDLTVCFGFMHHVPGFELRARVLETLIQATRPGGVVVISFWQFMNSTSIAAKARTLTQAVRESELCCQLDPTQLEEGDYFLDWQSDTSVLRYCHHTSDAEIDRLLATVSNCVTELERYSADGRGGNLNRYVILKRN